jgi:outer membrane protein OmpA-like peptidoglycan-associated protein
MKKILFLLAFASIFSAFGQSGKLQKADNYFSKLAYSYASSIYEELLGSEVESPEMVGKLAVCYYNLNQMSLAQSSFAKMIQTPAATKEHVFLYAHALKQNGKYAESDTWMTKFNDLSASDKRAISFITNPSYLDQIEKQGTHFTISNLASNSPVADFGGYPGNINGTAYFVSSRKKSIPIQNEWSWDSKRFLDLYAASIDQNKDFQSIELITKKVNTRFHEGPLCFSPDGKKVYFTRNNISKGKAKKDQKGIQNLKLYTAEIGVDGKWLNEKELPFNSKDFSVGHPTLSADGKTLYFASDMPGGYGGADLYSVTIKPDGTFDVPKNLGSQFNTEGQEMFPWLNSDGYIFFSSNGHVGLGGLDIFVMIPNKKGEFDKLMNVGMPVNGQNDDFAFAMNSDNLTGYFSSNRPGGKGDDDIYSYLLTKPFKINFSLSGTVTDNRSSEIIPGALIELKDIDGNIIASTIADENGHYNFDLEPEMDYKIEVSKDDYFDNSGKISTVDKDQSSSAINLDLALEKDPGLSLYCLITDKGSGLPLDSVSLKITDEKTGAEFLVVITPETGDVLKAIADKKIGDALNYKIEINREGYLSKTVNYIAKIEKPGVIEVQENIDLTMTKMDIGMDLSKLIDIKPIYFDLGKYVIRPDAALELDKIVKIMNEYPSMVVELGSHTDCRGSIASNATLSDNRAKASASYIQARIANPERIYGKGYGESKLITNCPCEGTVKSTCPETEHQKNRRTEFLIIKM